MNVPLWQLFVVAFATTIAYNVIKDVVRKVRRTKKSDNIKIYVSSDLTPQEAEHMKMWIDHFVKDEK